MKIYYASSDRIIKGLEEKCEKLDESSKSCHLEIKRLLSLNTKIRATEKDLKNKNALLLSDISDLKAEAKKAKKLVNQA